MNVFDAMGVFWAEIADKDQTERQIQFLKQVLKPDGYVLDLACGTGRHSIPLSMEGFGVVGLDISDKLLKIAKHRCGSVQLVRGDMRFLPFKSEAFGAVVSMDTSLGYLPSEKEDSQSLAEVRRILREDGLFIVDVFNRNNLTTKYRGKNQPPKSKEYPSFYLLQKRTVSDSGDWLCDSWTVHEKVTGEVRVFEHSVRLYKPERLQGLLETAGLVVKQVYGDYEQQAYSPDSNRLIMVATAK